MILKFINEVLSSLLRKEAQSSPRTYTRMDQAHDMLASPDHSTRLVGAQFLDGRRTDLNGPPLPTPSDILPAMDIPQIVPAPSRAVTQEERAQEFLDEEPPENLGDSLIRALQEGLEVYVDEGSIQEESEPVKTTKVEVETHIPGSSNSASKTTSITLAAMPEAVARIPESTSQVPLVKAPPAVALPMSPAQKRKEAEYLWGGTNLSKAEIARRVNAPVSTVRGWLKGL